jgi:hypothetical protein
MTLPPGDEPQAVQSDANLVGEIRIEYTGGDEPLAASDPAPATVESPPAETSALTPGSEEAPLFANVFQPEPPPPVRIPHLGHVALLLVYFLFGVVVAGVFLGLALHFHLFRVSSTDAALNDIHYTLGSELLLYLVTFAFSYFTFPLMWHMDFFAGVQWNGATALRLRWRLIGTGGLCFFIAILNILFVPGPANAPIERIFKQPGAAWLLFFFGITFAPFFEELFFRGFLLPALSTAYDWLAEKFYHKPRRPLGPNGHPQWSFSAMAIASVVTSVPFGLMHAHQTGDSADVVILLSCVSLVLCAVRLITRSLASSVLVHAFYNFLLFSMMLLGTEGFRHLDKM